MHLDSQVPLTDLIRHVYLWNQKQHTIWQSWSQQVSKLSSQQSTQSNSSVKSANYADPNLLFDEVLELVLNLLCHIRMAHAGCWWKWPTLLHGRSVFARDGWLKVKPQLLFFFNSKPLPLACFQIYWMSSTEQQSLFLQFLAHVNHICDFL